MPVKIPTLREVLTEYCEKRNIPKRRQVYATMMGKCYVVSVLMAKMIGNGARAVYGKYHGSNVERPNILFHRHGWVEYKGTIFDPTRWVFEDKKPHMWSGPADSDEYDEGSWKMLEDPIFKIEQPKRENEKLIFLDWETPWLPLFLSELFDDSRICTHMTPMELHYVAHISPKHLDGHSIEVYERMRELKLGAMIPMDSQLYADSLRKAAKKSPRRKK
ncbi:hypothetical protein LCGC14_0318020 [marine sediment metagenome]|uniref:Uncharacterized protein n=1 Tax=marine sediment metagenome TaxID=412755 RepID=A0A0F9WRZ1_9ZZZZ